MEITFGKGKIVTALSQGHIINTDQPVSNGGQDSAPSPFELYMVSIGTCCGIYVKSFCDNRNIPTDGISLTASIMVYSYEFPEKYKASVVHVAGLCKVKKSILAPPEFVIVASTL